MRPGASWRDCSLKNSSIGRGLPCFKQTTKVFLRFMPPFPPITLNILEMLHQSNACLLSLVSLLLVKPKQQKPLITAQPRFECMASKPSFENNHYVTSAMTESHVIATFGFWGDGGTPPGYLQTVNDLHFIDRSSIHSKLFRSQIDTFIKPFIGFVTQKQRPLDRTLLLRLRLSIGRAMASSHGCSKAACSLISPSLARDRSSKFIKT